MTKFEHESDFLLDQSQMQIEHDNIAFKKGAHSFLGGIAAMGVSALAVKFIFDGNTSGAVVSGSVAVAGGVWSWYALKSCIEHSIISGEIDKMRVPQVAKNCDDSSINNRE